ncbi:MAG: CHAT domain-containing protein [Zoogloeaceae bacterium]|nr:CHAT domain-containing protein [Zoogloeaceae bacterium]
MRLPATVSVIFLVVATRIVHANPVDNGDLVHAIAADIRTSLDDITLIVPSQARINTYGVLQVSLDGEYERAIRLYESLIARHREKEGRDDDHLMGMLATTYGKAGQHGKAISLAEQVLKNRRAQNDEKHFSVRQQLDSVAIIYRDAGQLDKALALQEETVRFNRDKLEAESVFTYLSELQLIDIYTALGQFDKARLLQEQLLAFWSPKNGPKSDFVLIPMRGLANTYRALGQPEKALPLLERFLEVWSKERPNESNVAFDTLLAMISLARTHHDLGQFEKARALIPAIIAETEKLRSTRSRTAEDRQRVFAMFSDVYQQMAGWSARAEQLEEAFNIGDLSKARTLAESIRMQVALRSLPAQEQQTLREMGARARELRGKVDAVLGRGTPDPSVLESIRSELANLRTQYEKWLVQLPGQAKLPNTDAPITRHAADLLGKGEVFISYLVSTEGVKPHLLVKAGTREQAEPSQQAKAQAFLLDASGKVQWIDLGRLPNHDRTVAAYRELITSVSPETLRGRLVALRDGGYQWVPLGESAPEGSRPEIAPAGSTPAAHALTVLQRYWHDTLIKPVLPLAGAYTRWIVSPDKDLALLPFDTLPEAFSAKGEPEKPLAEQRNLTLVQSFSVYALLKQREVEYAALPRPKALLAMGNAVYDSRDWAEKRGLRRGSGQRSFAPGNTPALLGAGIATMPQVAEQRAMTELKWMNLPGTAEEVRRIAGLFGQAAGGADSLTGTNASEAKLRELNQSGKLKDYRYLLFSAHGYLAQNPNLSSLVLSQHGNPAGLDGYVTAGEWPLYDVRSDLTVLSACDTGIGKVQAGESVVGLPYALFVAGNRNTLLSLWPVADEATAEFMARFFGKLKEGKSQPMALSETKLEFMRHPTWSRPAFWAAFVLYGV